MLQFTLDTNVRSGKKSSAAKRRRASNIFLLISLGLLFNKLFNSYLNDRQ
jgi:hypothetical protein